MKFDPRRARKKASNPKYNNKVWDFRKYKIKKRPLGLIGKPLTKEILKIFGEELVKGVQQEAKRASKISLGMPRTKSFIDSFYYEVLPDSSIRVKSDWRWIKKYLNKRKPYKMTWLTLQKGAKKTVPIKTKTGEIVFRNVPLKTSDAWIHPAIAKYNFIEVGIQKGEKKAIRRAARYLSQRGQR